MNAPTNVLNIPVYDFSGFRVGVGVEGGNGRCVWRERMGRWNKFIDGIIGIVDVYTASYKKYVPMLFYRLIYYSDRR